MSLEKLGLDPSATEDDVKARYRELAMDAHPDRGGSAERFQEVKNWRDQAIKEIGYGYTLANARSQLHALREAARGVKCPRCDGSGVGMTRQVGFRTFKTVCRLCLGKGKL
jgi:DnaJ-class molecular chaperone